MEQEHETQFLLSTPSRKSPYIKPLLITGKFLVCLGFGAASTAVFWTPSLAYGEKSPFGQWLSKEIGFNSGYIIFACSAPDFAGLAMYATLESFPAFVEYIAHQETIGRKILIGSAILGFSIMQATQVPAATYGTGGSWPFIVASAIGGFPNAFYVGTNIVKNDLMAIRQSLRKIYLAVHKCFVEPCSGIREDYFSERMLYQLHDQFILRLKAGQVELRRNKKTIQIADKDNINFQQQWLEIAGNYTGDENIDESLMHEAIKKMLQTGGIIFFVIVISATSMLNMMNNIMPKFIENTIGADFIGAVLCLSSVYLFYKLITEAIGNLYDGTRSILSCEPINSLGFQAHPVLKPTLLAACTLWSLLSFPTVLELFDHSYYGPYKNELGYDVSACIIFFHIISFMHCFDIFAQHITAYREESDPIRYALLEEYQAVKQAETSPTEKIMEEIYEMSDENQITLLGKNNSSYLKEAAKILQTQGVFKLTPKEEKSTIKASSGQGLTIQYQ